MKCLGIHFEKLNYKSSIAKQCEEPYQFSYFIFWFIFFHDCILQYISGVPLLQNDSSDSFSLTKFNRKSDINVFLNDKSHCYNSGNIKKEDEHYKPIKIFLM